MTRPGEIRAIDAEHVPQTHFAQEVVRNTEGVVAVVNKLEVTEKTGECSMGSAFSCSK